MKAKNTNYGYSLTFFPSFHFFLTSKPKYSHFVLVLHLNYLDSPLQFLRFQEIQNYFVSYCFLMTGI
jgi:hypothetical protein